MKQLPLLVTIFLLASAATVGAADAISFTGGLQTDRPTVESIGAWLAFRTELGMAGLWWGLVAALGAVCVLLVLRIRKRLGSSLERVYVDKSDGA